MRREFIDLGHTFLMVAFSPRAHRCSMNSLIVLLQCWGMWSPNTLCYYDLFWSAFFLKEYIAFQPVGSDGCWWFLHCFLWSVDRQFLEFTDISPEAVTGMHNFTQVHDILLLEHCSSAESLWETSRALVSYIVAIFCRFCLHYRKITNCNQCLDSDTISQNTIFVHYFCG